MGGLARSCFAVQLVTDFLEPKNLANGLAPVVVCSTHALFRASIVSSLVHPASYDVASSAIGCRDDNRVFETQSNNPPV